MWRHVESTARRKNCPAHDMAGAPRATLNFVQSDPFSFKQKMSFPCNFQGFTSALSYATVISNCGFASLCNHLGAKLACRSRRARVSPSPLLSSPLFAKFTFFFFLLSHSASPLPLFLLAHPLTANQSESFLHALLYTPSMDCNLR